MYNILNEMTKECNLCIGDAYVMAMVVTGIVAVGLIKAREYVDLRKINKTSKNNKQNELERSLN